MRNSLGNLEENGYLIAEAILSPEQAARILEALGASPSEGAGTRSLLGQAWCRELAEKLRSHPAISPHLIADPVAVQCTYFDKSESRNWLVASHQDLAIPVRARVHSPELGVWSEKEGVPFVQAPARLLEQLLAVRVHLDDCGPENGPVRVVPGSHRHGRLSEADVREFRANSAEVSCLVQLGGVLLMRPLLLHASSKALKPNHRRVLHFLYGPASPGYGLEWQHAV